MVPDPSRPRFHALGTNPIKLAAVIATAGRRIDPAVRESTFPGVEISPSLRMIAVVF
jgi:hypothetical protein